MPVLLSLPVAACLSAACVYVVKRIYTASKKLQSSGTLNPAQALLEEGSVYLTIPKNGSGKVRLVVQNRLKVMNAVAMNGDEIRTGQKVRVEGVLSDSTLQVSQI